MRLSDGAQEDLPLIRRRRPSQLQPVQAEQHEAPITRAIQLSTAEEPTVSGPEAVDVDRLADKVYQMMRRDLIIEGERRPRQAD